MRLGVRRWCWAVATPPHQATRLRIVGICCLLGKGQGGSQHGVSQRLRTAEKLEAIRESLEGGISRSQHAVSARIASRLRSVGALMRPAVRRTRRLSWTGAIVLHERAPLIAVRAVDAAVALFRPEDGSAERALEEKDAAIHGHRFSRDVIAFVESDISPLQGHVFKER